MTAARVDSHGREVRIRGRRVLNWYDRDELSHYIYRLAHRRTHRCTMSCPRIYFPCFWCGASCWSRRVDLFPVCDGCRPAKNAARNRMAVRMYRVEHPDAQRQTDRRAHHAKQRQGMRPYRDRREYLRGYHRDRSGWDLVRHREIGRRMSERRGDMRRYACAFRGEHHRNRRIDRIIVRSGRLRRERQ